mmetsp:Transcript_7699/g.25662  ORF Transcript_7699/g.25662 Transcript_7699/m.25662 type:complete len:264 (+) Transcript_7699:1560-2351(+)
MRTNLGEVQGWWSGDTTPVTPFHVRGFGFSGSQSGGAVTSLGVSKTRGALVTDGGDLYVFDVPTRSVETQQNIPPPTFEFKKVNGVRRITAVHIGEMHVLATRALTRPSVERVSRAEDGDGIHDDEDVLFSTAADGIAASSGDSSSTYDTSVASDEESDDQSHDSTDEPETPDACWFGEDDAPPSSSKPRNPPKKPRSPFPESLGATFPGPPPVGFEVRFRLSRVCPKRRRGDVVLARSALRGGKHGRGLRRKRGFRFRRRIN